MANPITTLYAGLTGFWKNLRGDVLAQALGENYSNYYSGLVGSATASAAGGTKCQVGINEFDTVAASSTATLPLAKPGAFCVTINNGANTLTVYPYEATSQINAGGAGVAISLASGKTAIHFCSKNLNWFRVLSA